MTEFLAPLGLARLQMFFAPARYNGRAMRAVLPLLTLALLTATAAAQSAAATPEDRAIAHLVREVPDWPTTEKCFSCHNNGVAAAALFAAVRRGHKVPEKSLAETLRWLSQPAKWSGKREGGAPTDETLVRIQFGAALADALDAGLVKERQPLRDAAKLIAAVQAKDGSWQVNAEGLLGSPTTLGTALATHMARRVLIQNR